MMKDNNEFLCEVWKKVNVIEWQEEERLKVIEREKKLRRESLLRSIMLISITTIVYLLIYFNIFHFHEEYLCVLFVICFLVLRKELKVSYEN